MTIMDLRHVLTLGGLLFLTNFITTVIAAVPSDSFVFNAGTLNNVTVAVNVPSNSTDDLFLHFSGPAGQQWLAFGFGEDMFNALMFVAYRADNNGNVTVSPRLSGGHVMPRHTDDVKVTVLPGSMVDDDGVYVVNIRCSGCRSWNGKTLDTSSTKQSMIWAVGPAMRESGPSFASTDVNAAIGQHAEAGMGSFSLDLQKATGDAGVPDVTGNVSSGNQADGGDQSAKEFPIAVHAFLMIAAFLVIFPGGYLCLRMFNRVWIHAGIQSIGVLLVLAGSIVGIVMSARSKYSSKFNSPHQIIGLVVFALVLISWTLGLVGHRIYKKTKTATLPTKIHRGFGPAAILLGLINVGIGFDYAGNTRHLIPFYIVTLLMIIFVSSVLFMLRRRRVRKAAMETPAARNFDQGYQGQECQMEPPPPSYDAAGYHGSRNARGQEHVPMQTFGPVQGRQSMHPGYRVE